MFIALGSCAFAQKQNVAGLKEAIAAFDKALAEPDSVALKKLLSDNVSYGHSNGWVETKREVIDDLYNGKLVYKTIIVTAPAVTIQGNVASARSMADIDAVLDGKEMSFKLKVLQVWTWENGHWTLFARQSVPMPKEKG